MTEAQFINLWAKTIDAALPDVEGSVVVFPDGKEEERDPGGRVARLARAAWFGELADSGATVYDKWMETVLSHPTDGEMVYVLGTATFRRKSPYSMWAKD